MEEEKKYMVEEEKVVEDGQKKVGKKVEWEEGEYVLGISLLQQGRPKLSRARRGDEHKPIAHCRKNQILVFVFVFVFAFVSVIVYGFVYVFVFVFIIVRVCTCG